MAVGTAPLEHTTIPQRLDALPWSRWHTHLVVALGVTWLLDGLEGSLGGSLAGALKSREGLSLTDAQLGLSSSVYLAGAVLGSIVLGALGSFRPSKNLLLDLARLSGCNYRQRRCMEPDKLHRLPLPHRSWYRRRVRSRELGYR